MKRYKCGGEVVDAISALNLYSVPDLGSGKELVSQSQQGCMSLSSSLLYLSLDHLSNGNTRKLRMEIGLQ